MKFVAGPSGVTVLVNVHNKDQSIIHIIWLLQLDENDSSRFYKVQSQTGFIK